MVDEDSDDYELLPHGQIEQLRKQLSEARKGPSGDIRGKDLKDSMDKLSSSLNKLISILEDAQQDIIDEYQESKPIEKLNQLLDQNETIARAIISINDRLGGTSNQNKPDQGDPSMNLQFENQLMPPPQPMNFRPSQQMNPNMQNSPMQPPSQLMPPSMAQQNRPLNQPNQQINPMSNMQMNTFQQPFQQDIPFNSLPALDTPPAPDNLPPLVPPLDQDMLPEHKKKKFLGFM